MGSEDALIGSSKSLSQSFQMCLDSTAVVPIAFSDINVLSIGGAEEIRDRRR